MVEPAQKNEPLSVSAALAGAHSYLQKKTFKIVGEVSELNDKKGYKAVYFSIKDESATLSCTLWKSTYYKVQKAHPGFSLSIGEKIQVEGKFGIWVEKGRMSFYVTSVSRAGDGELRARVEQLAMKLKAEGLTDPARKLPIPEYPTRIAIVTSPRGAAIHDALRTLRRRFPVAEVVFAGVPVEGKGKDAARSAAKIIADALLVVAQAKPDVILLLRGGGSFEDLMPFNDEHLARTIASIPIPVVTGIGHERDTYIADMVSDKRVSTPTAAGEAVSPDKKELFSTFFNIEKRMSGSLSHRLVRSQVYLDSIASRPSLADPLSLFRSEMLSLDHYASRLEYRLGDLLEPKEKEFQQLEARLDNAFKQNLNMDRKTLEHHAQSLYRIGKTFSHQYETEISHKADILSTIGASFANPWASQMSLFASRLNDLSPLKTLERGWSIASNENDEVIKSVDQVSEGDSLTIKVQDGEILCEVKESNERKLFELIPLED